MRSINHHLLPLTLATILFAPIQLSAQEIPVVVPGQTISQTIPAQYTPAVGTVPVGTPTITVPRTCAGSVACVGPVTVPGTVITTVGPVAPIQVTPPITVSFATTGMDAEVDPALGTLVSIPRTSLYLPNPLGPPIPVEVCPETCVVPGVSLAENMETSVTITVTAGATTVSRTVPIALTSTPGTLRFASAAYTVAHTSGSAVITVTRDGGSLGEASVNYATADGSANSPWDYITTTGTLTWAHGESGAKSFAVPIVCSAAGCGPPYNTKFEPDETFTVSLSNATGAILGAPSSTTVTILAHWEAYGP